ncbi:hypothetical protein AB0O05_28825 [Streptomyces sp. NPDC093084]|uniref:hypothetical protein n=1 Tax=Streptomyces sp. NPDC093084 TaxID=3155197 RepID=UPI00341C6332
MNAPQPQAAKTPEPEPEPVVRWNATERRDAERVRLLVMIFGPRTADRTEPGHG